MDHKILEIKTPQTLASVETIISSEAAIYRCSSKQMLLKIYEDSQENTYVAVFILIKLQAWRLKGATLLKKRLRHRYFLVNYEKFLIATTNGHMGQSIQE